MKFVVSGLFHSYLKPFSYWNMSLILYETFFDYSSIFIMFNDIYQNADKSKFILGYSTLFWRITFCYISRL